MKALVEGEVRRGLPFSRLQIKAAEDAAASAPKGPTGYPMDNSMTIFSQMTRANAEYRRAHHRNRARMKVFRGH